MLRQTVLRPHQLQAMEDITQVLSSEDRVILTMACGTGKTRTSGSIAEHFAPTRVLRTFPSLALITQTLDELDRAFGRASLGRVIAVCSDSRLLARFQARLDAAEALVLSDAAQLAEQVARPGKVTVCCTLQSLEVLISAHADHGMPAWDVLVIDEAHRTVGWEDRTWAAVHDQALIPAVRRLNMTATLKNIATRAADEFSRVLSMENEKVFGRVGHRLSFGQAVKLKILARYRLVMPVITDSEVHRLATAATDPEFLSTGPSAISAPVLATQVALLRAATQFGARRMVTYHRTIADARWFSSTLHRALELLPADERPPALWAGHVHGGQSVAQRDKILDHLRSDVPGLVVVSNAHVLTEGVNIPEIDSVAFLSPRGPIDYVQAFGRAARLPDPTVEKEALFFTPVLLGPDDDPVEALDTSPYSTAFGVVRAMASHDDDLAVDLASMRRSLGHDSYQGAGSTAHALPDWLSVTGIEVPPSFASAITLQVIRSATAPWEEFLAATAAFHAEHGHIDIPRGWTTPDDLAVGNWLEYQRNRHAKELLTAEEVGQLEALGIVWNKYDSKWELFVSDLTEFRSEFGHLNVPQTYVNPAGRPLGSQVGTRRLAFADLPQDRADELRALGFIVNSRDHQWHQHFAAWLAFSNEHGHPLVPVKHVTATGLKLGAWRMSQLQLYRAGTMPAERAKLVRERNFHLTGDEYKRQRNIQALREFRAQHGHVRLPYNYVTPDGIELASWLFPQRRAMRDGRLTVEQTKELLDLGVQPSASPGRPQ
ncbi:Helicase associated domain protein [Kitasatospora sp. NPDC098652]|uniref:DEAD/DEAH box helicase n=1 Tax=Kitasatospora sp. NPDC098652 TaxID=3364095 RepID=UPI00381C0805